MSLKRPDVKLTKEEGDALTRELEIQKSFFYNPKDCSKFVKLGQNQIMCPRVPIQLHYNVGNNVIWKTQEQVQRDQADIIGQPVPVVAVGDGTMIENRIAVDDYVMLVGRAEPLRSFYMNNVKFDIFDMMSIACVINKEYKSRFTHKFKDTPPAIVPTEDKEVQMPQSAE